MTTTDALLFTTVTSESSGSGTGGSVWNNLANVQADDGANASSTDVGFGTQLFKALDPDLSTVPADATITQIDIGVKKSSNFAGGGHSGRFYVDVEVYLIVDSLAVGVNKAQSTPVWPLTATTSTYTWSSVDIAALGGLTGADIQSGFGFYLYAEENQTDGDCTAYIDYVWVMVSYITSGGAPGVVIIPLRRRRR